MSSSAVGERFEALLANALQNLPTRRKATLMHKAMKFVEALKSTMTQEEIFFALASAAMYQGDAYMDEVRAQLGAEIMSKNGVKP